MNVLKDRYFSREIHSVDGTLVLQIPHQADREPVIISAITPAKQLSAWRKSPVFRQALPAMEIQSVHGV
ncbi:hypothetical protein [Serratia symbiotica]|uniref:Uncharacterized protein n=1 Tax=Serratia symbiotica TaxID=138074 RepID=A0A7D5NKT5_9GAMM|nr:hypothetical protein [Serratia symbiotica]QLH62711.1 hypothetical protein SYMBAF_06790 [Serratia symbiotica]